MRIARCGGLAGLAIALIAPPSAATNINPPAGLRVPAQRANRSLVPRSASRRPAFAVQPTGCASDSGAGEYFIGVGTSNVAGADSSAVLGGDNNESCSVQSTIGGGAFNVVSVSAAPLEAFIGAGYGNAVTGIVGFVGSGQGNESSGYASFVGGGSFNLAEAPGSFVGAGGYDDSLFNTNVGGDNVANGIDSFVGAGDLNHISSTGNGSFIGGGGYNFASGGAATPNNQISGADSFIGAGDNNSISSAASSAAIVGGNHNETTAQSAFVGAGGYNNATGQGSLVGAGFGNSAGGSGSFIGAGGSIFTGSSVTGMDSFLGAGDQNTVGGNEAFVGGGQSNSIGVAATYGVVGGGKYNNATGATSTIGGGAYNSATGTHATVPGGYENEAEAQDSFAAGYQAKARNTGAFVWSDDASSTLVQSTKNDQFMTRASGGYVFYSDTAGDGATLAAGSGAWASLSDRARKSNIVPLDDAAVLDKVAALPVSEWSYTAERGVRHVGPMAQDFYAAFKVGEDDRHITSIDEDGVALAAIKALHAENARLHDENQGLRKELEAGNAQLRARLVILEAKLDRLASRGDR